MLYDAFLPVEGQFSIYFSLAETALLLFGFTLLGE